MNSDDLKQRTKAFALRIIRLVESLPPGIIADPFLSLPSILREETNAVATK
jgi:hypothetical protein